jgi:hypothetical protein
VVSLQKILVEWACGVLLGFLRKTGAKTWCFSGEVVVFCVVSVVIKQSSFVVMGNVTQILNLFLGFPFRE